MKYLAIILLFSGCVTEARYRNGQVAFRTFNDVATLDFSAVGAGEAIKLSMTGHKPSTTIRAAGSLIGTAGTGLTGIATAMMTRGF